jgi:serine/threonine-protein kinase
VSPTPTFPTIYGAYALLKTLSDEGAWSAHLIAIDGAAVPWVIKRRSIQGADGLDLKTAKAETKVLARMSSPYWAKVLTATEIDGEVGIVMEHVPGKSLAEICRTANEKGLLIPPELGLVVAHDAFCGMLYFHEFENASRLHGNLSPRTIILSYAGEMKLVGYRPGRHGRAENADQVTKDLMPLAPILCEVPFKTFPTELAEIVPRLHEDRIAPAEALAAVRGFLGRHAPTAEDRKKLATWMDDVFPGERNKESAEGERLVADGLKLIAQSTAAKLGLSKNPVVGDEIGEYKVVEVLGEGGMGRVYEAENVRTGKRVALKLLHPKGRTAEVEERFRREADAILRIANPHVVDIEQFGTSADGKSLYLAMELIHGESLDRVLHEQAPFESLRALKIAAQICQALTATHAAEIVHRDLKPGNVMLVPRDNEVDFVKILDFGLARLDIGEAALTRVGDVIGTLLYMAPEQGLGKPATPKIDIYAVGEILYEMLTKRLPHEGSDDIISRKATIEPTPIATYRPDLREDIGRLVMKAISRDPRERHATMAELGQEIDELIARLDVLPSTQERPWMKFAIAGGIGAIIVAGAALAGIGRNRTTTAAVFPTVPVTEAPVSAPPPSVARAQPPTAALPTEPAKTVEPAPAASVAIKSQPKAKASDAHPVKHRTDESESDVLLAAAKTAYDSGNHLEAIKLGLQALNEGGGLRAHLALGNYYRGMARYRDALQHYHAALELDPSNAVAATGSKLVERQLSSSP